MESRETIRAAKALILAGGLLIIGIVVGFILAGDWNVHSQSSAQNVNAASATNALESPFTRIADRTLPAVVSIETKRNVSQSNPSFEGPYGDFFRRLFPDQPQGEGDGSDQRRQMRVPSSGSGFIFDKQGRILTNNHVVRDAAEITVTLGNHKKYKAKVVGTDPSTDVAVIQIQGTGDFPVVPLGDSEEIRIGDWAIAIGNALGELEGTLTVGVVSAKGRSNLSIVGGAPVYQSFIQTDASINFGNSGGPLLNIRGEAIGINTAINPSGEGIGFAIPINMAKSIATQLVSTGKVTRGYLGIVPQELTPELAENWGIDTKGVLVGSVSGDGPASKAGFQVKDVITTFDGKNVDDVERFRLLVADTPVNKKVRVGVIRSGKTRDLYVTLSERPAEEALQRQARPAANTLGVRVESVTGETAKDLGIEEKEGVLVIDVVEGGNGEEAGLRRGDVIKEVNDRPVKDTFEYDEQVRRARERNPEKPIVLLIKRGDSTRFIAVQPGE